MTISLSENAARRVARAVRRVERASFNAPGLAPRNTHEPIAWYPWRNDEVGVTAPGYAVIEPYGAYEQTGFGGVLFMGRRPTSAARPNFWLVNGAVDVPYGEKGWCRIEGPCEVLLDPAYIGSSMTSVTDLGPVAGQWYLSPTQIGWKHFYGPLATQPDPLHPGPPRPRVLAWQTPKITQPYASAVLSGTQSISTTTPTIVALGVNLASGVTWSNSTSKATFTSPGVYQFAASLSAESNTMGSRGRLQAYQNGQSLVWSIDSHAKVIAYQSVFSLAGLVNVVAGDTFDLRFSCSSGLHTWTIDQAMLTISRVAQ